MSARRPVVVLLALAFLSLALAVAAADARRVPTRVMGVKWTDRVPRIDVSNVDMVNDKVRRKLQSGLPQTIVTRILAYSSDGKRAFAASALMCRVVYDLWEGSYRTEQQAPHLRRSEVLHDVTAVTSRCFVLAGFPVGQAADYQGKASMSFYFGVVTELNPLSAESTRRIRQWLSRSGGRPENDAFFGSFVSLFVTRRIGSAEHIVSYRSQALAVPP
jgi:hypothetical protein